MAKQIQIFKTSFYIINIMNLFRSFQWIFFSFHVFMPHRVVFMVLLRFDTLTLEINPTTDY